VTSKISAYKFPFRSLLFLSIPNRCKNIPFFEKRKEELKYHGKRYKWDRNCKPLPYSHHGIRERHMSKMEFQKRFIRAFPGRVRMEVYGLKSNQKTAERILQWFQSRSGISSVIPCTATGRVLIAYEPAQISLTEICGEIRSLEESLVQESMDFCHSSHESKEVAATREESDARVAAEIPNDFYMLPKLPQQRIGEQKTPRVPLPLALSVGGLTALGLKQLFIGKSALARSPAAFHLASLVSVVTGYSFLKRGFQRFSQENKWNADLILGTGSLALALIRENLVVLAGLSLLHYFNWKRSQHTLASVDRPKDVPLSKEIQDYSEKASRLGMILAAGTLAITRDPLRALAVLLAINPRPATVSAEYAWNQTEWTLRERGFPIPQSGSLPQLARTRTILLEDTSCIVKSKPMDIQCIAEEDPDKVWCLAGALFKHSDHPWKEQVIQRAKQTGRTMRTAFHVETENEGIKGEVNGSPVLMGSRAFMLQHQVDCTEYERKARRLEKYGSQIMFVAKQTEHGMSCIGLLAKETDVAQEYSSLLTLSKQAKWNVAVLHNSSNLHNQYFDQQGIDTSWLSLQPDDVLRKVADLQRQGQDVLFITGDKENRSSRFLRNSGIPTLSYHQLPQFHQTVVSAQQTERLVQQHLQWTKLWNVIGFALAIGTPVAAPLVNLLADSLLLAFFTRAKRMESRMAFISPGNQPIPSNKEVAVTTEPLPWHAMSKDEVLQVFGVEEQIGLHRDQVALARRYYGPNQLNPKQPTPWHRAFLQQFKDFTPLILLGASLLAMVTGGTFDGLAMGAVLLVNAVIGVTQERKAEQVMDAFKQYQPLQCKVIREGQEYEIEATDLVPGDVVCLEAGERVPADIRLTGCWNLQVNESNLSGESLPVDKQVEAVAEDCPLPERQNMLFMGTDVTRGKGIGVVVKTGMQTEMGHFLSLMKENTKEVTPLQEKVTSISKTFFKGAMLAGALVFVTGLLRGIPLTELLTTSITLAASAVPEGLPVTITIALSAGIFRMARKNALTRKLSALETLGRTTVICTDKTGTLTKNEMTVKTISTVHHTWFVTGDGYEPTGSIREADTGEVAVTSTLPKPTDTTLDNPDLERLIQIGLLCNNSKLEEQEGRWTVKGDPTEGALLSLAAKTGLKPDKMTTWSRCHEVPFDSQAGRMSVVCQDTAHGEDCYVFCKGSIEAILERCTHFQANGEIHPLTEEQKKQILQQNERLAKDALRVLGFAYRSIQWEKNKSKPLDENLIYVGLVGMMDPPKEDIEQSIQEAYTLGVQPVMITGDHPITAIAIAKKLGIWDGKRGVLSGPELDRMSDAELAESVENVCIFARVTPEHKLRIVAAFQARGHIVTMTGDGVNDTPAIQKANVGIAMGRTGTDVTKEAADMVLKEDHFGSIVEGVKEGRTIIGNIRKAIGCLLTGNLAEILVTTSAVVMGLPIPLVPIQILLMNLLTDALPAMVLAINPGIKKKETRRQDIVDKPLYTKVVTRGLLLGAGSLGLFAWSLASGAPLAVAQTVAFVTLVAGQLVQTFSWKQEGSEGSIRDLTKDRYLLGAMGVSLLALLTVLYVPSVAGLFHTAPLTLKHWISILLVAGSVSKLSDPLLKLFTRSRHVGMPLITPNIA
jgi:Ca2+-transporting ATPase